MYRDRWIETFEVLFYGAGLFIAGTSAIAFAAHGDWWWGLGFLTVLGAMCVLSRVVFFRPHLVIGDGVFLLAGVLRTRRVAFVDVEKAVAAKGSLSLRLRDHDEVYVPGHYGGRGPRDQYWALAAEINARLARARRGAEPAAD